MNGITKFILAAALVAAVTPAIAKSKMMGSHSMAGTVTSVDGSTGMMGVNAGGHALTLHFPPSALSDVKEGDKITLHMSFSKS